MYIGVTLAFYEKKSNSILGILKSLVLNIKKSDFVSETNNIGNKIAAHDISSYLGINDVFFVSGEPKQGEILGRTSYFDYSKIEKAKELKNKFSKTESGTFLSSLIYFCSDKKGEKFTLTVLTIIDLTSASFEKQIKQIANEMKFKNKIIEISVDEIASLEFIGVESLKKIDLKFNVFETLYCDFDSLDVLSEEVLTTDDLDEILSDIYKD